MSRVERAPSIRPARPVAVEIAAPAAPAASPASMAPSAPILGIALFWRIGADALHTARPDLAALVMGQRPAHPTDEVTLELLLDAGAAPSFRATLHGPRGSAPLPIPAGVTIAITHEPPQDLLHIDALHAEAIGPHAPLLRATIRLGPGRPAPLLYARTSLLATLKLPGGRYEPDHAEVSRHDS